MINYFGFNSKDTTNTILSKLWWKTLTVVASKSFKNNFDVHA